MAKMKKSRTLITVQLTIQSHQARTTGMTLLNKEDYNNNDYIHTHYSPGATIYIHITAQRLLYTYTL